MHMVMSKLATKKLTETYTTNHSNIAIAATMLAALNLVQQAGYA